MAEAKRPDVLDGAFTRRDAFRAAMAIGAGAALIGASAYTIESWLPGESLNGLHRPADWWEDIHPSDALEWPWKRFDPPERLIRLDDRVYDVGIMYTDVMALEQQRRGLPPAAEVHQTPVVATYNMDAIFPGVVWA
jgi:hypothetical protein